VVLKATPKDADGKAVEGVAVAFSTSDVKVATVDAASGKVTAVDSGDAKISAGVEGKISVDVPVKVSIPASVSLAPAEVKLDGVGAKATVVAKVLDSKGREIPTAQVAWESGNPAVATVVGGEITAVGGGAAQVFAVAAGVRAPVAVTVAVPQVAAIDVEKKIPDIKVGATHKLKVAAKDAQGKEIPGLTLTFTSADPKIATVDATGMVTAVAKGKTKVTVAAGEKNATVEIKVKK
jgi:uncharacterized protein YjdB